MVSNKRNLLKLANEIKQNTNNQEKLPMTVEGINKVIPDEEFAKFSVMIS